MQAMEPLDERKLRWVAETLSAMSMEERVAQLLIPMAPTDEAADGLAARLGDIPVGGVFFFHGTTAEIRRRAERLQARSRIPLVVAADLECGAGHILTDAVAFPEPLALAAADDEKLAYTMGKAAALQGRAAGIHWTYAPVVDVNLNPDNPIANTRSMGDDPRRVARLAAAVARGMQDHGLAACAKHFPGDGVDDLDQHTVTSINSLTLSRWREVFGHTFGSMVKENVLSMMVGHIALPAWDGARDRRGAFPPATVSRRIVTDLLRNELGFQGLIVTDDMNMGGVSGYLNRRDRTVACIHAGCDMILFPKLPDDFRVLLAAARSGELPESRIEEAARSVLTFKARLGFDRGRLFGEYPDAAAVAEFEESSSRIARASLVKVRDVDRLIPLRALKRGARVLTITLSLEQADLAVVDQELRARGFLVDHLFNPVDFHFPERTATYDAVFVNFLYKAEWAMQTVRCVGAHNRTFLGGFYLDHPCVVFTSFGSPYHLRMFSALPNYLNVHSSKPVCQAAAVAAWFGEIPMRGTSPVSNLTREFPER